MSSKVNYHFSHVANEHREWLRGIEFYQYEIDVLKKRLAEVSQDYTQSEVKAQVEHFENQFHIQLNNLSELKGYVKKHERHIDKDIEDHAQHLSKETLEEHDQTRDKYYSLERVINQLRHEFNVFLAKYM